MDVQPQSVIDAHLHLWDRSHLEYPWMSALPRLPHSSLPGEPGALLAESGESSEAGEASGGAVVIEAGARSDQSLAEVEWLSDLARSAPGIHGIVAAVDLTDPHLEAELDRLRVHPLVVGVRDNFESRADGELDIRHSDTAAMLHRGITTVLAAGLTFDVCVRREQLEELTHLLRSIAETSGSASGIVVDHLGKPRPLEGEAANRAWARDLGSLAQIPDLHIKFSGLPGQIPGPVDVDRAHILADTYAGDVLDAFGPARTMYGTDHPVSTLAHRLGAPDWEDAVAAAIGRRVDADGHDAIMGGTAARFYGLRKRS